MSGPIPGINGGDVPPAPQARVEVLPDQEDVIQNGDADVNIEDQEIFGDGEDEGEQVYADSPPLSQADVATLLAIQQGVQRQPPQENPRSSPAPDATPPYNRLYPNRSQWVREKPWRTLRAQDLVHSVWSLNDSNRTPIPSLHWKALKKAAKGPWEGFAKNFYKSIPRSFAWYSLIGRLFDLRYFSKWAGHSYYKNNFKNRMDGRAKRINNYDVQQFDQCLRLIGDQQSDEFQEVNLRLARAIIVGHGNILSPTVGYPDYSIARAERILTQVLDHSQKRLLTANVKLSSALGQLHSDTGGYVEQLLDLFSRSQSSLAGLSAPRETHDAAYLAQLKLQEMVFDEESLANKEQFAAKMKSFGQTLLSWCNEALKTWANEEAAEKIILLRPKANAIFNLANRMANAQSTAEHITTIGEQLSILSQESLTNSPWALENNPADTADLPRALHALSRAVTAWEKTPSYLLDIEELHQAREQLRHHLDVMGAAYLLRASANEALADNKSNDVKVNDLKLNGYIRAQQDYQRAHALYSASETRIVGQWVRFIRKVQREGYGYFESDKDNDFKKEVTTAGNGVTLCDAGQSRIMAKLSRIQVIDTTKIPSFWKQLHDNNPWMTFHMGRWIYNEVQSNKAPEDRYQEAMEYFAKALQKANSLDATLRYYYDVKDEFLEDLRYWLEKAKLRRDVAVTVKSATNYEAQGGKTNLRKAQDLIFNAYLIEQKVMDCIVNHEQAQFLRAGLSRIKARLRELDRGKRPEDRSSPWFLQKHAERLLYGTDLHPGIGKLLTDPKFEAYKLVRESWLQNAKQDIVNLTYAKIGSGYVPTPELKAQIGVFFDEATQMRQEGHNKRDLAAKLALLTNATARPGNEVDHTRATKAMQRAQTWGQPPECLNWPPRGDFQFSDTTMFMPTPTGTDLDATSRQQYYGGDYRWGDENRLNPYGNFDHDFRYDDNDDAYGRRYDPYGYNFGV